MKIMQNWRENLYYIICISLSLFTFAIMVLGFCLDTETNNSLFLSILIIPIATIIVSLISFLYFIPLAIACNKTHQDLFIILFFNIILGWSIIGWALTLVYALNGKTPATTKKSLKINPNKIKLKRIIDN
jgi:hypothetical protein